MSRHFLLRTLSVAALTAAASPVLAQSVAQGGGATQSEGAYIALEALFNGGTPAATFGTYWAAGSTTGQTALLNNDLTCDINKVTGANGGKCSGSVGGANTVHYAASDAPLTSTQTSSWATSTVGQAAAGNLIQVPTFGTSTGIVVNDTNVTKNGQVVLSDNDLCGVFSGLITDFSQITDSPVSPAPGPFKVVYRSDSSATTFLLTNHLAAVCTSSNTAPGVTFVATTTFSSLFPNGINNQIPGAVGESLSSGVANYLSGLVNGPVPQAVGALSPDWTSLYSKSAGTVLSNGQPSALLVAAISSGAVTAQIPTEANVALGLTHVVLGTNKTPPTKATAANPLVWLPVVQTVSKGYPIVGYSSVDLAQCYADPNIKSAVISFLTDVYTVTAYKNIQVADGFVPLAKTAGTKFLVAVENAILSNKNKWGVDIGDAAACAGKAGR